METTYLGPRLKGNSSTFQQWSIPPLSSNTFWNSSDVIKIMGNVSEGLIDFYRSHISFTVECKSDVGLMQVDSSAQSFISQTVLLSRQTQVQRIQQYDSLASILSDIGFSEYVCENRSGQGLGFTNIPIPSPLCQVKQRNQNTYYNVGNVLPTQGIMQSSNSGGYMPTMNPQSPSSSLWGYVSGDQTSLQDVGTNTVAANIGGGSYIDYSNWLVFGGGNHNLVPYTQATHRGLGIRAQYNIGMQNNGYPSAPWSISQDSPRVKNQIWDYSNMTSVGYTPGRPYQLDISPVGCQTMHNYIGYNGGTSSQAGYSKPIASSFATGCFQPFLSSTVPQVQMIDGAILPTPIPLTRKTFRIPLLSAICGVLIPPDQFQLIPAESVRDIILQITLSPFAMFTSGYKDVHQFDKVGMQPNNMQERNWVLKEFQWVWHLYNFTSSEMNAQIKEKLYKGITISSNYWQLSAQYQLPNGSYIRNYFQIPVNVQSLGDIVIIFVPNQYQTKTFCRKHFHISNNVTSMQFKVNGAYYPLQPIVGNAGNPETVDQTGDNWPFYEQMLLSNNFLFNTNNPLPRVNQKNFAINGRIYDVDKTATMLNPSYWNTGISGQFNDVFQTVSQLAGTVNSQTAMGCPYFHQNRYCARAMYWYSFQPYGHSKGFINGINTVDYRQFDVMFNNQPTNVFPTDQTMLIFTRANVLVTYKSGFIQVQGA